jgi:hypothetical protein
MGLQRKDRPPLVSCALDDTSKLATDGLAATSAEVGSQTVSKEEDS